MGDDGLTEDGVDGVHGNLVLGGVADKPLGVGERDIRRRGAVALVVGDDLDTVVLPDTDTPENFIVRTKCR